MATQRDGDPSSEKQQREEKTQKWPEGTLLDAAARL